MSRGERPLLEPLLKVPNQEIHLYSAFFAFAVNLFVNFFLGVGLRAHTTKHGQRGQAARGGRQGGRGGVVSSFACVTDRTDITRYTTDTR